jgi:hypothetical protein
VSEHDNNNKITDEKMERAAAASRRFDVGPVEHSHNLRSRVGVQLCIYILSHLLQSGCIASK